jgi:hypothetical protein
VPAGFVLRLAGCRIRLALLTLLALRRGLRILILRAHD